MKLLHLLPLAAASLGSIALTSCTASEDGAPEGVFEDEADADLVALPTPYTAEQIQGGCLPGTMIVFRIEAVGQPTLHQTTRFTADDGETATIESWVETPEGTPMGSRNEQRSAWSELRDHALFPVGAARERETVSIEHGDYESWRYSMPFDDARGKGTTTMWFADRFPGPPILMTEVLDGAEVMRMEMIARAMP